MNLGHLALEAPLEELFGLHELAQPLSLTGVGGHHQNERHDLRRAGRAVVAIQFHRHMIVVVDGIFELDLLKLLFAHGAGVKVLSRSDGGFLDETVGHRLA